MKLTPTAQKPRLPLTLRTRLRFASLRDRLFIGGWRPQTLPDWLAAGLIGSLFVAGVVSDVWLARHGLAIHRLKRGVGDTTFYTADGRPWFRMDEQRRDVPLDRIATDLRQAVIAVEDHRFYYHPGVDPIALARAVFRDVRSRGLVEGGSTLTQQLARTLFLSNVRTYGRKAKEAALSLMMEQQLTKDQILELYLNRIYLSAGVYGVEPMSRKLFGKGARDLTLGEAALIAGLIRAPSALSPWTNPDGAIRRSHLVLERMRAERFITPEQEAAARRSRPKVRPYTAAEHARAAYAKEFLRQQFRERFGGDHPPDWQVHTTFSPEAQDAAERAVAAGLARLNRAELQAALVALDPRTGNLVALVGGRDFRRFPYNRAARSRRQPGSAFKPFVYAAALEHGFSPISALTVPDTIPAPGPDEWAPRNANGPSPPEVTLRAALLESNNRAAVALQERVGSRPVLRLAHDVGLEDLPNVPSLALGTGLVSPLELTAAFAVFPNGGLAVAPRALVRVLDADASVVLDHRVQSRRVISEQTAFQMVSMLRDVVDRGTAAPAGALGVRFPAGGKTGTTNDFKDAWFVGFSSELVAGVWVGFDHPQAISADAYGARVALPIWADFMRQTARAFSPGEFIAPAGLREEELCRVSYLKPVEGCPTYQEYLKGDDPTPSRLCTLHRGNFKQRVRRVVEGVLAALGKRFKGIFSR